MKANMRTSRRPQLALFVTAFLLSLVVGSTVLTPSLFAQTPASDAPAAPEDELALRQSNIAGRYLQLEKLILRMAEFDAADNPRRAELLKQAFAMSKDRHVTMQLDKLVELLNQKQLGRAVSNQKDVHGDLNALLELLLSENRADRLKDEQARIRGYIKEIERIERMQRSVQGRTEGGIDPKQAAKEQNRVAERTGDLNKEIAKNETPSGDGKDGEGQDGKEGEDKEGEDSEGKDGEAKEGEGEAKDGESKSGESKDGEGKDGEGKDGKGADGESKDGKPSEGKPSEGEPKDSEGKKGEPKDGEGKDPKDSEGKPSEGKPSEGKPSEGEAQSEGEPSEGEPSEGKPSAKENRQRRKTVTRKTVTRQTLRR